MRILLLSHEHPPIGGGAAAVCAALARQYALVGHSVVVVTMAFDDLPMHELVDGYEIHRIDCHRQRKEMASPWEGLVWSQRCWSLVQKLHSQRSFDATHAHFIMPAGIVATKAKRTLGIPCVITPHGSDVPGYNRERMKLVHRIVRPWWKSICRQADLISSPSQSLLNLINASSNGHRGMVVPNGFELGRFRPGNKEKRILLCSRLVERKGFQHCLQVLSEIELPGWEVDVIGDGPMFDRLKKLADTSRVPVTMHGWIDNDDPRLANLYSKAMIFVFPSEWENFSIALLEAMSAGCAVITTGISGNPEAVGDTGVLIPANDRHAIGEALQELSGDPMRCRELGRQAAKRAEEMFDWRVIAARYLGLLSDLRSNGQTKPCASA